MAIPDEKKRLEPGSANSNVKRQVKNVASDVFVQDAWCARPATQRPWVGLFA